MNFKEVMNTFHQKYLPTDGGGLFTPEKKMFGFVIGFNRVPCILSGLLGPSQPLSCKVC